MGHCISALITQNSVNESVAKKYDLPILTEGDFLIVALDPSHADYWDEKLGFNYEKLSSIMMDTKCIHYFAEELGLHKFAIIYTDYFGGVGSQSSAVYKSGQQIMPPTKDGINKALKMIGVQKHGDKDEFDSINLGKYRHFDNYFKKYNDL